MDTRRARKHPLFDHPEVRADFRFWAKVPFYSADEATALWLGLDPDIVNPATLAPYSSDARAKEYQRRKFLITRAVIAKEFTEEIPPRALNAWCNRIQTPLPSALGETIVALPQPEPMVPKDALLRLARLEREARLGTTERNSLLTLVGSMAVDKYGYTTGAKRQHATKLIAGATERAGKRLSLDTVHKYLALASEFLSENRDDNPDSD